MTAQWAWASHQPVIASLLELYKPDFVFESGVGLYSTPLFKNGNVAEYIGVENDADWIIKVKEAVPSFNIIYHNLNNVNTSERWFNLTAKQKYDIVAFYSEFPESLNLEKKGTKLLFVDGYACTRMYAINALWEYFDVIIYHDSRYRKIYGYDRLKVKGYRHYEAVASNAGANTGIFLKKNIGFTAFNNEMQRNVKMFNARWCVNSMIKLHNA